MFVAVEGMDGSGKSTQIELLRQKLELNGLDFIITREPGGTRIGERLREIILSPENGEMFPQTEALLYAASRAQHVNQVIHPALAEGKIVISDRYVVSSYVYQGIAREQGLEAVKNINQFAIQGLIPDLTIFLFVNQETALARKKNQKQLDRLEAEGESFHQKVNRGFCDLAESYEYPKLILHADDGIESVHQQIWQCIEKAIKANQEKKQ